MSVNAFGSQPMGKSVGAAGVGMIVTLAIFVVVFVAFLIAPLIVLALAFLAYLVMRPRQTRAGAPGEDADAGSSPTGFGAGTR